MRAYRKCHHLNHRREYNFGVSSVYICAPIQLVIVYTIGMSMVSCSVYICAPIELVIAYTMGMSMV